MCQAVVKRLVALGIRRYEQPDVQFKRLLYKRLENSEYAESLPNLLEDPQFPRRFEVIGDAVLVPKDGFCSKSWRSVVLGLFASDSGDPVEATAWSNFFSLMAACFGARIVVRDAGSIHAHGHVLVRDSLSLTPIVLSAVDSGIMRQSKRVILFDRNNSPSTQEAKDVKNPSLPSPQVLHTGYACAA